jgi:hypothetical protein
MRETPVDAFVPCLTVHRDGPELAAITLRPRYQGSADRHDNLASDNAVRGERDGLMRHVAFGSPA